MVNNYSKQISEFTCKLEITHNEDKFPNQEPQCCHHGFENFTKEE